MRPIAVALGFTLCGLAFNAHAEEIKRTSKIDAVTVFPRGAEITRQVEVTVPKGDHTIVLRDLPAALVSNSIRVSGKVTGPLAIGSVDSRTVYVEQNKDGALDKTARDEIEKQIEELTDERDVLDDKIKAARTQKSYIERLAWNPYPRSGDPGKSFPGNPQTSPLKAEDLSQIFFLIGTSLEKANEVIRETQIERRGLDKKIKALRKKLSSQPARQERRTEVKINVSAENEASGTLSVIYQVRGASWAPLYDARLTTAADGQTAALSLSRRATISQTSGEGWENVELKLSTTRPGQGTAAPDLRPVKVSIRKPRPKVAPYGDLSKPQARGGSAGQMSLQAKRRLAAPAPVMEAAAEHQVTDRVAQVTTQAFQAVFRIPGRSSVAETGEAKKVQIAMSEHKPDLMVRATPKLNTTAYLYAAFKPGGTVPLLPGQVVLYRDGTFVGTGRLPLVNPDELHELGFGADDAIKVTRKEIERAKGETGLITTSKLDERRFKITVENQRKTDAKVMVLDQVPYSEEEKVDVEVLGATTRPSATNYKDKRGILMWEFDLAAGKSRAITLAYRITWPRDKQVVSERQ